MMDGPSEELLSRPRLPRQKDGRIGGRHLPDLLEGLPEGRAFPHDPGKVQFDGEAFLQDEVLAGEAAVLQRALDEHHQVITVDGFLEEIVRPFLHGRHGVLDRPKSGHDDHGEGRLCLTGGSEDLKTIGAGQLEVGEDEKIFLLVKPPKRLFPVRRVF